MNDPSRHNRPGVGVAVIIEKDNAVLLILRQNAHGAGTWAPPGGHLEYGESLEECAIREIEEETNLHISDVYFRGLTNDLFEADGKHYITLWMEARGIEGDAIINAAEEMSAIGWFRWDSLPRPLFSPLQQLLDGACYPAAVG